MATGTSSVTGSKSPQAPGAWPVIGHIPSLVRNPLRFVTRLNRYGDVLTLRLGMLPVHLVTHPKLIHQVLVESDRRIERGRLVEKSTPYLGKGLITSSGDHQRQRRMLQPAFHQEKITSYTNTLVKSAQAAADSWSEGHVVRIDRAMNDLSLDMLTNALFGASFDTQAAQQFQQGLEIMFGGIVRRTILPDWWSALPTPGNRRFTRSIGTIHRIVDDTIAHHRNHQDGNSLVSMLLAARDDDGNTLSNREIRDQVVTFAMAGVETTGATLAWALHLLGQDPDIDRRLHAELDEVLHGRPPRFEDLSALPFTRRVVRETLRLYPPWLLSRRTLAPVRIGTAEVPAGAEIGCSIYAMHRDPRWYPDPERFDPDRWLPERSHGRAKETYAPFGTGARKCIGDRFALTEVTVALAVLCQRWRLTPVPGVRVREVTRGDVHPSKQPMRVEPRTS
ncbi:cytochrome P450 [Streptomyces beigongshangae]|uniref:cytochrome P450 n=1 Tax=Streptomyces beigongshangae TaxID=2841597 RepID=UPI0021A8E403|nr:cytochrome P450 [Streptomyces sp. REN17]